MYVRHRCTKRSMGLAMIGASTRMERIMTSTPLWQPDATAADTTLIGRFAARHAPANAVRNPAALHEWSINDPEAFWSAVWADGEVIGEAGATVLQPGASMREARWFPGASLNYAENLLRRRDAGDAIVFWGEDEVKCRLSHAELYRAVAQVAAAMRELGVVAGDRVAAWLPNVPETVVVMLAATSIGAIFTSASPDFGVDGVFDRFGQCCPKLLFACDAYLYNGKVIDCLPKVAALSGRLPGLRRVVMVPYLHAEASLDGVAHARSWADFISAFRHQTEIRFERLPFDHPLFIMYSSGTTGVPKCIVHRAGGVLLQHLKELRLHSDVRPGDRLFYFTTCGWMMWNWQVSALACGATLLLYDGAPLMADGALLFDLADAEHMTHFGTSAKFLDAIDKAGLVPARTHRLADLRVMLSTGSPLVAERFDYVYRSIKTDLQLASISGGTDIVSCFVLGHPLLPVWRGEIQCAGLGMAVTVFDDEGQSMAPGGKGELVCTRPFPSMPIGFWGDEDGSRYRAAYFERYDGVWHHGDFCARTEHDGFIIHGRSDATLNPGGVRIGTAEIYRQVEALDAVAEALVVGQEVGDGDTQVVLFLRMQAGCVLDDALRQQIGARIREHASPRHVPARILEVAEMPRTRSGKLVELAVREIIHGRPVRNVQALANPEVLASFARHPGLRDG